MQTRRFSSRMLAVVLTAIVLAVASCAPAATAPTPAPSATTAVSTPAPSATATRAATAPVAAATVSTSVTGVATSIAPKDAATTATTGATRSVVDSRGVTVQVPAQIKTVATISDALVEEVMIALKVEAKVNMIGATCLVRDFTYDFTANDGKKFSYFGGMNPANYLAPYLRDQEYFVKSGTEMNFETLVKAKPDVLIIHAGCCTLSWKAGDDQKMNSTLNKLKDLGIPTIVVYGPNFSGEPTVQRLSEDVRIIGQVFGKEEQAKKLADYLEGQIQLVNDRTKDIADAKKPRVLLFGLNPTVRQSGGSGNAFGLLDIQSYMLEKIVHAKNAFQDNSFGKDLNAEQVLALNPDVFVLPTSNGYHPPRELYDTPDFKNLATLKAIQNRRIVALPWSPCNCDQRLEYPINVMVMAKAAYPELFADVKLESWLIQFFKNVYGVDDQKADGLIDALWMDWARGQ